MNASEIISVLKSEIADFDRKTGVQEGGTVVRVGDGIATVYGMQHAMYGELVEFETGVRGIIQNLEEKTVGVVLLGSDYGIVEGTQVMRTKKRAGVGVGSGLIGESLMHWVLRLMAVHRLNRKTITRLNGKQPVLQTESPFLFRCKLVFFPSTPCSRLDVDREN